MKWNRMQNFCGGDFVPSPREREKCQKQCANYSRDLEAQGRKIVGRGKPQGEGDHKVL